MTQSRKKVILRPLSGAPVTGYLLPSAFVRAGTLDLLDLDGRSYPFSLERIKLICFVRDFNLDDPENPERLTRRAFLSRPRAEGLWLRITFPTGDQLEGVAAPNLTLLDSLLEDTGLFLIPPDERANTHRIYVPRAAIAAIELLAVINAPARKPAKPTRLPQPNLFDSQ